MPAGAPSKYKPEFCEVFESEMKLGYSKLAAASIVGVSYQTVQNWVSEFPEFREAIKRGDAHRARYFETDLMTATLGPQVSRSIFGLKNAARDEWRDEKTIDNTSSDGSMSPIPKNTDIEKLRQARDLIYGAGDEPTTKED